MSKPHELEQAFRKLEPNRELLAALHKKNQKEYIRCRLKGIGLLWEGKSRQEVAKALGKHENTVMEWVRTLVTHGVEDGLRN